MKLISLIGQHFGKWRVLTRHQENYRRDQPQWVCICECGTERVVLGGSLRDGRSQDCGCGRRARMSARQTTHGHAKKRDETATYQVWKHIIQRCTNPNTTDFKYYGGRGISVCERWKDFANFLTDMGQRPEGLTIDRINNDGDYEPGNCRWTTMREQNANKRGNFTCAT